MTQQNRSLFHKTSEVSLQATTCGLSLVVLVVRYTILWLSFDVNAICYITSLFSYLLRSSYCCLYTYFLLSSVFVLIFFNIRIHHIDLFLPLSVFISVIRICRANLFLLLFVFVAEPIFSGCQFHQHFLCSYFERRSLMSKALRYKLFFVKALTKRLWKLMIKTK